VTAAKAAAWWVRPSQASQHKPVEVLSIQYLRAVAAIGVLVFHTAERAGVGFGPGAAGVDVFFVISGFIMWMITGERGTRPWTFLARRAARIIPLYWLVTLSVAALAIVIPSAFPHLKPTADHVFKSLLFYPHADSNGDIAPLIVPGWTLDYEMFFYVVFAACLLLPGRLRAYALTIALGLLVAAGYAFRPLNPALATYSNPLLLEFLAGVWLGAMWVKGIRLRRGIAEAAISLGVAGFALVAALGIDVEPVRILAWGIPAFLIVAGAVSREPLRKWPAGKFLGDASYSIYLVHGLAISFCARLLTMLHVGSLAVFFVVSLCGGIVLGAACYCFVERPLLRLFRSSRRKHVPDARSSDPAGDLSPIGALVAPADRGVAPVSQHS
jgi:exopolysaccharide production protein ExoZ